MQSAPNDPQLLFLGKKDTKRLLEIYVKRSLSLNDGQAAGHQQGPKPRKWVTRAEKSNRVRRHSSDSSAHLGPGETPENVAVFQLPCPEPPPEPTAECSVEPERKPKKSSKKGKKSSVLKSFLSLFYRKGGEEKEDKESSPEKSGVRTPPETPSPVVSCLPGPFSGGDQGSLRPAKALKKKPSRKKFSFRSSSSDEAKTPKKPTTLVLPSKVHSPDAVVSVEPTSAYYEKVSEELERIVKEVKDSPSDETHPTFTDAIHQAARDEETIQKIITLLKQQGDDIDLEIRENGQVSSFFRTLSYSSFQRLADRYVNEEVPRQLPQDTAGPELVKFAFTLDFTAKVAGLSSQTVGRIMGFGNQYLQDRFTQMSKSQMPESRGQAALSFTGPD